MPQRDLFGWTTGRSNPHSSLTNARATQAMARRAHDRQTCGAPEAAARGLAADPLPTPSAPDMCLVASNPVLPVRQCFLPGRHSRAMVLFKADARLREVHARSRPSSRRKCLRQLGVHRRHRRGGGAALHRLQEALLDRAAAPRELPEAWRRPQRGRRTKMRWWCSREHRRGRLRPWCEGVVCSSSARLRPAIWPPPDAGPCRRPAASAATRRCASVGG